MFADKSTSHIYTMFGGPYMREYIPTQQPGVGQFTGWNYVTKFGVKFKIYITIYKEKHHSVLPRIQNKIYLI